MAATKKGREMLDSILYVALAHIMNAVKSYGGPGESVDQVGGPPMVRGTGDHLAKDVIRIFWPIKWSRC